MDMVQQDAKSKAEIIAEQSIEFFDLVSSEKTTPKDLAAEHGLSLKTVYNRINQGREMVERQLREMGDKLLADVYRKYEFIWEQAKIRWEATNDVNFLKEMRSVLEAQRKMLSLDNAAKAPVNPDGTVHNDALVLVFDDSGYKQKEKEFEEKVIAGTYRLQPNDEQKNGTTVLLPESKDVVE